jgi:excinuclease ABC subunit A
MASGNPKKIEVKGARVHNLKNLSVEIAHGKMTVITGLSGSGKSSLAFDTLYAEGQRRYIESLSSYARQFLGKLDKPETDYIKGIAPAIAIEQKVISSNPRSTVGTTTEIYDYLKILFARTGKTISPVSGKEVKKHTVSNVVDHILSFSEGEKLLITCPLVNIEKYGKEKGLRILFDQGYTRILTPNGSTSIEDELASNNELSATDLLIIDRISVERSEESVARFSDSVQLAFSEGHGDCTICSADGSNYATFSTRFELDNMEFQEPNEHFFTFNNPFGACKTCEGYGSVIGIDEKLVFPDRSLSVFQGAVAPWRGETMGEYLQELVYSASKFDFPIHRPVSELTQEEYALLWEGNKHFTGIKRFFKFIESQTYKIQYRVMLSRYRFDAGKGSSYLFFRTGFE